MATANEDHPSRISFGSCNDHDLHNKMWAIIRERNPSAFIWGGDAVYADHPTPTDWTTFPPTWAKDNCADGEQVRNLLKMQKKAEGYKALAESNVTIFGTFDDHDYGCDNADSTFPHRTESAKAFAEFIGESRNSLMAKRARKGYGAYGVKVFDFERPVNERTLSDWEAAVDSDLRDVLNIPHSYSNKTVAVFVLDIRSNKTPWKQGSDAFHSDTEGDFLGERQWKWFESSISRSTASVNVIVNGLQVHANLFPNGNWAESWTRYPRAQQRLYDAVLQANVAAPILISGDVHMTQFMRKDCQQKGDAIRPLVEITTSGMTHSWGTIDSPPLNNPEWTPSLRNRYGTYVKRSLMTIMHNVCPWTNIMIASSSATVTENGGAEGAKAGKQYSLEKNFGELEFDWKSRTVLARSIGEDGGAPLLSARWSMDQLSGKTNMPGSLLTKEQFVAEGTSRAKILHSHGHWICVNYRGSVSELSYMIGHFATFLGIIFVVSWPLLLSTIVLKLVSRRHPRKSKDCCDKQVRRGSGSSVDTRLTYESSSSLDYDSDSMNSSMQHLGSESRNTRVVNVL